MTKPVSASSFFRKAFPSLQEIMDFIRDCELCKVEYTIKKIPKKGGGLRIAHDPSKELKTIQKEILRLISFWPVDDCQFGFVKKRTCLTNALHHFHTYTIKHQRQKVPVEKAPVWMLKIDLKDAFPSIKSKHLKLLFENMFFPLLTGIFPEINDKESKIVYKKLVSQFVRLTAYQGKIPQGASCSPYLFNLVIFRSGIVRRIRSKCEERAELYHRKRCQITPFKFSIYADDIVITSLKDRIPNRFIKEIIEIIESRGIFKINPAKTCRSSLKYKSHLITGIVIDREWSISGKHITLSRKVRKTYRGKLHRATAILMNGRLPSKERDGLSIEQAIGIAGRIRDVFQEYSLPSDLKPIVEKFKIAWIEFNKGFD